MCYTIISTCSQCDYNENKQTLTGILVASGFVFFYSQLCCFIVHFQHIMFHIQVGYRFSIVYQNSIVYEYIQFFFSKIWSLCLLQSLRNRYSLSPLSWKHVVIVVCNFYFSSLSLTSLQPTVSCSLTMFLIHDNGSV